MGKKWPQSPKWEGNNFAPLLFPRQCPSAGQWGLSSSRKCFWLSTVDGGGSKSEREGERATDDSVGTTKLYCVFIQPVADD